MKLRRMEANICVISFMKSWNQLPSHMGDPCLETRLTSPTKKGTQSNLSARSIPSLVIYQSKFAQIGFRNF